MTDVNKEIEDVIRGNHFDTHNSPRAPEREIVVSLPQAVIKLSDFMAAEFQAAASKCFENAEALRHIAANIEQRGQRLLDASPKVRGDMEDWIAFQIETARAMDTLGPILRRAGPSTDV